MKAKVTYKKIAKDTKEESLKNFEMCIDDAQMNLPDGFWLLNREKSKDSITLEIWQSGQFLIDICVTSGKQQTLHLKFYDFDIFLNFELCENV